MAAPVRTAKRPRPMGDPSALVLVESAELLAVQVYGAAGGPVEPREESEERRLATAGWPDDGDEPPRSTLNVISFNTVSRRPPER